MLTAEAFCFENSDCIERIEIKLKVLIVGKYSVFVSQLIEKYDKEGWEVYLLTGSNKKIDDIKMFLSNMIFSIILTV